MATAAKNAEQNMTAEDLAALRAAGDRYNSATTQAERDAAHAEAEAIRGRYNYSGGSDGSQYIANSNKPYGDVSSSGTNGSPTTPKTQPPATPKQSSLTPTQVYRDGRYINAFINENGQTVNMNGGAFNFNNGDIVKTNGGNYIWQNGKASLYKGAFPEPDSESYSHYTINGEPVELYNVLESLPQWEEQRADIQRQFDEIRKQLMRSNQAGTDLGILQLQAQLENGLSDYDLQREQAAIAQARAANNAALRNAAAGDMGGIGQKQYSAEQNSYDQQMLSIQLEQINFTNEINQQIAQLEAQGRYNEAQLLAEWGQQKVNMMQDQYDWYWNLREQNAYAIDYLNKQIESEQYAREQAADELAYTRAMQRLQLGVFNADDAKALGIPEKDAEELAQYYNTLAQIDLDAAKAQLAKSSGSGRGSGGSGGGYSGGSGDDSAENNDWNIMERMYAAGVTPDSFFTAIQSGRFGKPASTSKEYLGALYGEYQKYYSAASSGIPSADSPGLDPNYVNTMLDKYGIPFRLGSTGGGNGSVYVQGYGTVSRDELSRMIANNLVEGVDADGGIVYVYRNTNAPRMGGGILGQQAR